VSLVSITRKIPGLRTARIEPFTALMLAVVLGLSLLILCMPLIVFGLSFREGRPIDPETAYSFVHYIQVFSDTYTYRVFLNTFGYSITSLLVAFGFGLPAAWLAERTDLPLKPLLYTLMTVGLLMPGFATAMGWLFLFHPRIGLGNVLLNNLSDGAIGPINIASIGGMGWVEGLSLAPVAFIMTAAVFRAMDPSLEESAEMSGAKATTIARRVTLPLAWPGILASGIYIFTIAFAAFDVPAIIGWSNKIFTFSTYVVTELAPDDDLPHYGVAAALATFVIVLAGVLSWWYGRLQSQAHRYQVVTGKGYRPRLLALKQRAGLAWGFLALFFFLSKLLPLLLLIWASLLPFFQLPSAEAFASISLANYNAIPWDLAFKGFKNTAALVVMTPTITLFCAMAFSWVVLRSRIPGKGFFDFIAFLPHAIPNIIFGVAILLLALFVLRDTIPLFGTIWILLIVFVIARLSYATRMTNSTMIQIHKDLEESGTMCGATTGTVMFRVVTPLLAPTLIYAWLWIALITFRELTLAVILTTGDNITLPVVVWSLWYSSGLGAAAALTLLLMLMMLPIVGLYWWVARKRAFGASN
jgi:iron(III) transport system permease protein